MSSVSSSNWNENFTLSQLVASNIDVHCLTQRRTVYQVVPETRYIRDLKYLRGQELTLTQIDPGTRNIKYFK